MYLEQEMYVTELKKLSNMKIFTFNREKISNYEQDKRYHRDYGRPGGGGGTRGKSARIL